MKKLLLILLLPVLALAQDSVTVMLLGDSYTEYDWGGGYKPYAYHYCDTAGVLVKFIGRTTTTDGSPYFSGAPATDYLSFDWPVAARHHEGVSGKAAFQWAVTGAASVTAAVTANTPDILVIYGSVNDISNGTRSTTQMVSNMATMIDQAWAVNSETKIIVCNLAKTKAANGWNDSIDAYNAKLPAMIVSKQDGIKYLRLIDADAVMNETTDFASDGHPSTSYGATKNTNGYWKLGNLIGAAIVSAINYEGGTFWAWYGTWSQGAASSWGAGSGGTTKYMPVDTLIKHIGRITHLVVFPTDEIVDDDASPYFSLSKNFSGNNDSVKFWYGDGGTGAGGTIYKLRDSLHAKNKFIILCIQAVNPSVGLTYVIADSARTQTFVNALRDWMYLHNFDGVNLNTEADLTESQLTRFFRILRTAIPDKIIAAIPPQYFVSDYVNSKSYIDYLTPQCYGGYYTYAWGGSANTVFLKEPMYTTGKPSGAEHTTLLTNGPGIWYSNGWPKDKIVITLSNEAFAYRGASSFTMWQAPSIGGTMFMADTVAQMWKTRGGTEYWSSNIGTYIQGQATQTFYNGGVGFNSGQYFYIATLSQRNLDSVFAWGTANGYKHWGLFDIGTDSRVPATIKMPIHNRLGQLMGTESVPTPPYDAPTYTITATAGIGGSITPSGSVSVDSGDAQEFSWSASAGYQVASVTVDGSPVSSVSPYTFSDVSTNHTISVTFGEIPLIKETTFSANGKYLVDENGDYKILMHDAGWGMFVFISKEDAYDYLDTRKEQGFNAILTALPPPWEAIGESVQKDVGTRNNTYKGENYYQDPPWGATPFTTYNTNYWANADSVINYAESIGMTLIIVPAFIGYDCASDGYGWASEMNARTNANMTSYGNFLAQRYGEKTNIIWSSGGDCNPSTCTNVQSRLRYMVDGVNAYDGVSLWTNHNQRGTLGTDYYSSDKAWLTLNSIYTDSNDVNELAKSALYQNRPYFGIEGRYEVNEAGASVNPQVARKQAYWPMLMGASGWCYGHFSVYTNATGWKDSLNSLGVARMRYAKGMFESYDWWKLRPDTSHNLVTSGYGTFGNYDYVGAGISSDSTFAIIYLPLRKTITINTNLLNRDSVNWYWFNVNDSSKTFYKSTGRSAGLTGIPSTSGDWVLLLESFTGEPEEPVIPRYTLTSSASAGGSISPLGEVELDSNSTYVYTITPDEDFHLDYILVDNYAVDSTTSYTFTGLAANHTIYAHFAPDNISGYGIVTSLLPNTSAGSAYSKQLVGVGGNLDWRILRGRLHEGLWMDWNGTIQGTTEETGSKTFTVVIRERGERVRRATQTYTLTSSTLPASPTLTAPANGATGVAVDTLVSWSSVSGATKYHVQIDNNSDFGSPIVNDSTVTVTYKSMGGLNTSTQHYWRVRAGNVSGWSDYTSSRTFTTAAAEGGPISLVTSAIFTPANITADSCAASLTVPSGTNQLALVYLSTNVKVAFDSVKWGTQNFTLVEALNAGGANRREIWRLVNPSAATGSVVAYRDDNAYVGMIVAVFNNVNQSDPIGNSNTSYGTSTSASVSVSSSSGNVVVDCLGGTFTGSTTFSQGAGQTVVQEAEDTTVPMGMSYKSGATTTTLTWTLSGSQSWRQGAVELINEP